MSRTALIPTLLARGIEAATLASLAGYRVEVTHLALGDAGYTPTREQGGLVSERVRIPLYDAQEKSPGHLHMNALVEGDDEFWVREVGFLLADGTPFAVWSNPEWALAWKQAGIDLLIAYDLLLSEVPEGSVTVVSTGADLSLSMVSEYAVLATAQIHVMTRQIQQRFETEKIKLALRALGVTP